MTDKNFTTRTHLHTYIHTHIDESRTQIHDDLIVNANELLFLFKYLDIYNYVVLKNWQKLFLDPGHTFKFIKLSFI